jgi:replication factor C subunit 3/5
MSDYEDEMDVDVPAPKSAVQFSSDNASKRAKRPAADLPVEAQDNLPWVEKYRPNTLDDVSGHQDILATINKFIEANVCVKSIIETTHTNVIAAVTPSSALWSSGYR